VDSPRKFTGNLQLIPGEARAQLLAHFSPCYACQKRLVGRHGGRPSHDQCRRKPWSWRAPALVVPLIGVDVGEPRLRGTAALQVATDHRCRGRKGIAGRSLGGRPLRRRREMVLSVGIIPRIRPRRRYS
jgi:hypothetical protein